MKPQQHLQNLSCFNDKPSYYGNHVKQKIKYHQDHANIYINVLNEIKRGYKPV